MILNVFTCFFLSFRVFLIGILISILMISTMPNQVHSAIIMQFSSFGGAASTSAWSGTSIMTLVSYIAQLAEQSNVVGAAHNRTVNIVVPPLPFPNPFSLTRVMVETFKSTGSVIGFTSNKEIQGNIKVLIYDMFGNRVMQKNYSSEDTVNRQVRSDTNGNMFTQLTINQSMLEYSPSAGVYFYVVQADGKHIGKGKMLIVP
ncbi:hypothetical protein CL648_00200 [bacterium]|nr:hypothetical protein [bacterium]